MSYEPLRVDTIGTRLAAIEPVRSRLGNEPATWRAQEIGDGNLNLVFLVQSPIGSVVVKQALPYVRLVGESWPLPLRRAYFEYHALVRQARRDPGRVPAVYHFDQLQALIVMEHLTPHVILRHSLMGGVRHPQLARHLGLFAARTAFRGSDLSMQAAARKADLGLFAANVELCDITENLVFTDPYYAAPMNRHTSPQLDAAVAALRSDVDLKVEAQHLKLIFASRAETLLHGDLHTGSIMVTADDSRVIDAEFAAYGPMSFDIGMLLGNFLMAYFAQTGHERAPGERDEYRAWILGAIVEIWNSFCAEFAVLWRTERAGMLYPKCLFEEQGHSGGAERALQARLASIWAEMLGFAGIEMHRRIVGLAHIAEFERISDATIRAGCEAQAIACGRHLVVTRDQLRSPHELCAIARRYNGGS